MDEEFKNDIPTTVHWSKADCPRPQEAVRDIFKKYVMRIKPGGYLVLCSDSAGAKSLLREEQIDTQLQRHVVTYGLGESSDWRAIMLVPNPQGGTDYTVVYKRKPMTRVSLRMPGMYNVLNPLAVIVVMSLLAAEKERDGDEQARVMKTASVAASNSLAEFAGLRRRFDYLGTVQGCHIIDDYAHHPTEVRAVLQAARQRFDQQPIWVIFQPHTVSRLATFLLDFAPAFSAADRVIVTKVYTARNIQIVKMVTGEDLTNAIIGPPAVYIPELVDVGSQVIGRKDMTSSIFDIWGEIFHRKKARQGTVIRGTQMCCLVKQSSGLGKSVVQPSPLRRCTASDQSLVEMCWRLSIDRTRHS